MIDYVMLDNLHITISAGEWKYLNNNKYENFGSINQYK